MFLFTVITHLPGAPSAACPPVMTQTVAPSRARACQAAIAAHRAELVDVLGAGEAKRTTILVATCRQASLVGTGVLAGVGR